MALIRAMNTGVTGLQSHTTAVDVIGDNLANVTTTAFKQARTNFETLLSQTIRFGSAAGGNNGGIDPLQVGLGVSVGNVQKLFTQGALKPTGINTDLAIEGDGFFVERDLTGAQVFSRDGTFTLNPLQFLHNPSTGNIVQGVQADLTTFVVPAGGTPVNLSIPVGQLTIARETDNSIWEGNLNAGGILAIDGTVLESEALFDGTLATPATAGTLLTALGKSNGGSPAAFISLGLAVGDTITAKAVKGGREITGTFVVGSPPPIGGSTLGDFRAFLQRTFGVREGSTPGTELHGAVRRDATGVQIADTVDLLGAFATGTVTFSDIAPLLATPTAGDTFTIDVDGGGATPAVTFTATAAATRTATEFFIGTGTTSAAATIDAARKLADAINTNTTTSSIVIASTNPTAAPGVVTITARAAGTGGNVITIAEASAEMAVSGATLAGGGAGADSVSLVTAGDPQIFELFDADVNFVTSGVQRGDFIRFSSGTNAGQIGRITAVGTPDSLASDFRIRWEAEATNTLPATTDAYFIHEAAEIDIGVGSTGALADGLDPASPIGTLRIAGHVGTSNGITNLELTEGGTRLMSFTQKVAAQGESTFAGTTVFDSLGNPRRMEFTFSLVGTHSNGSIWRWYAESPDNTTVPGVTTDRSVGTGLINFDRLGKFASATGTTLSLSLTAAGVTTPLVYTVDFSRLTGFASTVDALGRPLNLTSVEQTRQDGFEQGTLRDFTIGADGLVSGLFTNGLARDLGRVVIARFPNNNGLIEVGDNVFHRGVNSGDPVIGTPGTFGRGFVRQGFLEESNVELSSQFTELIINQRAFQANARTISVANEMLRDLINLA